MNVLPNLFDYISCWVLGRKETILIHLYSCLPAAEKPDFPQRNCQNAGGNHSPTLHDFAQRKDIDDLP